jgi:catechol 2,3-dioxygenase-like lactoylglutathione lyase family enzyme
MRTQDGSGDALQGVITYGDVARRGPSRLHHVAVVTRDIAAARRFYVDLVGLTPHPTKPNWLLSDESGAVHLLERPDLALEQSSADRLAHLALQVDSLERICERLLAAGIVPFQHDLQYRRREITGSDFDLDWGLGTLFALDPDGHAVEFVEPERGIFGEHARSDM